MSTKISTIKENIVEPYQLNSAIRNQSTNQVDNEN